MKMLESFAWPPTHGPNGEEIVEIVVTESCENNVHTYLPPAYPSRFVEEYDDDDLVFSRVLTEQEFAAAVKRYEVALAEWKRTGGKIVELGPVTQEAVVKLASGGTARAIGAGDRGRWVEWNPAPTG